MSTKLTMSEAEAYALPLSVPVAVAGRAWGMGAQRSREAARNGDFPCAVVKVGARYRVPKSALLAALGLATAGAPIPAAADEKGAATNGQAGKLRALRG